MTTTLYVAIIGALAVTLAAVVGFAGRWFVDRPRERGEFLLKELAFLSEQVPMLRSEVVRLTQELATERANHTRELSETQSQHKREISESESRHRIELAERDAMIATLSVRVSELERKASTPAERSADARRATRILSRPDDIGGLGGEGE